MDTQTDPCLVASQPTLFTPLPASPHPRLPGLPVLLHGRKGAGSCGLRWDGLGRPGSPGEENKPGAPTAAGGRGAGCRTGCRTEEQAANYCQFQEQATRASNAVVIPVHPRLLTPRRGAVRELPFQLTCFPPGGFQPFSSHGTQTNS